MHTMIIEVVLWDGQKQADGLLAKIESDPRVLSAVEVS
jgi:hypothetical protein